MKNQRNQSLILFIFSIVLIVGVSFFVFNDTFGRIQNKGEDFIVQWLAVRTFAKENLSPYSSAVYTRTQEFILGDQDVSGVKWLKFSSPLYSVILIIPLALIGKMRIAQLIWLVLSGLVLIANTRITIRLIGWKPTLWVLLFMKLFSLLGYHNFQALTSGSLIVLASFLLFSSLAAIRSQRYELAGFLLAMSTIQPRAVLLAVLFVLFWSLSKRLWRIIFWFFTSLVFLLVLGVVFIPDWLIQYLRVIWSFQNYFPIITPVSIFSAELPGVGRQLGIGLSLLMIVILIFEWIAARGKDFHWFLWTISLTLVISPFTGIPANPKDFVLLLLPLSLILAVWDRHFLNLGKWMQAFSLIFLLFGLWLIFLMTSMNMDVMQQSRIFLFPMPLFLLIGLYWVRWRAVRPRISFVEEIRVVDGL